MQPNQLTNTILMVRPTDFVFNEQTAVDNEFQHQLNGENATEKALAEFEQAVEMLRNSGVEVLVVEKDPNLPAMPDAVFPNNWFGTDEEGSVHIFPMKTENRRAETLQIDKVLGLLESAGFEVDREMNWEEILGKGVVLEGTGSLILDRVNRVVYAALSERTQKEAVLKFAKIMRMQAVLFHTQSSVGKEYYHTNVVMSIGEKMAVVCLECIPDEKERQMVKAKLSEHHHVIEISGEQLEKGFCGNLLQVKDEMERPVSVLSSTAFDSLTTQQIEEMKKFGKLIPIHIPTIEYVGGGSIRCMMAEIFCPREA